jgi:hypothetical protein
MKRKGMSKKLRFSVFERDGFTCRYCGKTPPDVKLVVDHIEPVSKGGGDDESNLVTSCACCNGGKGARKLGALPKDTDLRRAQELIEQADQAKLTIRVAKLEQKARQEMTNMFCNIFGVGSLPRRDVSNMINLSREFNPHKVIDWLQRASARGIDYRHAIQYVCGIAKHVREDGQ